MKRAFLFASLCLSLAMGGSILVRSGYPTPFAARQQGGRPSFHNAKAGDAREVGGVKLRWCPPGRFLMGSPPDEAQAAIGRGAGRGEVDQRLLDGQASFPATRKGENAWYSKSSNYGRSRYTNLMAGK